MTRTLPGNPYYPGGMTSAEMLHSARVTPAPRFRDLDGPPEAPHPCRICGGGPRDPMHRSDHHGSEVRNQHEYEPEPLDDSEEFQQRSLDALDLNANARKGVGRE